MSVEVRSRFWYALPQLKYLAMPWLTEPANAPYVGLDYCYNTTLNQWSCTHPPNNSESIQAFPAQQCYDDSIIAFAGPSSLQPILSLPTDVGGSTVWFSEVNPSSYVLNPSYTPTTTSIQVTASVPTTVEVVSATSSSPASVATSFASTTSGPTGTSAGQSASAVPSSSSGLSSGAKIGIGVGVGIGALGLIVVGAGMFLSLRRRSHQPVPQTDDSAYAYASDVKTTRPVPPTELPGTAPRTYQYDQAGYGDGYGGSSTVANWDSPAPTYQSHVLPITRPAGHDRLHEIG